MGAFDSILEQNTQAAALAVRIGSSVVADPKVINGMIGTVYAPELNPSDTLFVATQGATNTQVLLSAFGACGTATGESFTVAQSYAGSQMTDSLGLQIPSAPATGDPVQVRRDSRTGSRTIVRRPVRPQKRQWFLQDLRPLDGVLVKHYGTYAFVDNNGVTHQPPGKRDPVVNIPGVGAHIDLDTLKFDENGAMYADFFGTGGPNGSAGTSVNGLNAGHGIEIIPGFSPTDSPSLTIETGGSVPAGSYQWAYCYVIDSKRTPLSPSVSGVTLAATVGPPSTPAYLQPHLLIPGKPEIIHATALELYRKDASVGANGSIHTKFAYAGTPGVLITDSTTAAVPIASGAYTGMEQYTVTATHSGVDATDVFEYNPLCRVAVGDPPIPYDPRDGSLTTLVVNGANDGSTIFKTSDGGAFNQITGDITYPTDSPLNFSGFRLVDTLTPSVDAQDYIDTKADAALGIAFKRDPTVINIKPARYILAPFSSMSPVPGTVPPLYELSGLKFSSSDPLVSNDGVTVNTKYGTIIDKENQVDVLLAASGVLPATGTGDQTARALAGYDANVYNVSALSVTKGDSGTGLGVLYNPATLEEDSQGRLNVIGGGGGGGGGGTGSPVAFSTGGALETASIAVGAGKFVDAHGWSADVDVGGWVTAGTDIFASGTTMVVPVAATYEIGVDVRVDSGGAPHGKFAIQLYQNGSNFYQMQFSYDDTNGVDTWPGTLVKLVTCALHDTLQVRVFNSSITGGCAVAEGSINIHKV